ncbi:MAG: hypothetical protein ABFR89_10265 [Actinomycetota bacterium]
MNDLQRRLRELDHLDAPDMRAAIDVRAGGLAAAVPAPNPEANSGWWRGPLVAVGTAVAILVAAALMVLSLGTDRGDVADTSVQPMPTTVPSVSTTVVGSIEEWNPILSIASARPVPPAAICPADADPEVPGPPDQPRPEARWIGNLAGAFDHRMGRVLYVDVTGETWFFDVCTNTWHRAEPTDTPVDAEDLYDAAGEPSGALGQLVYDADSDVTVSLGFGGVAVYDAAANTWVRRADPPDGTWPRGAAYDPVSGLVVTSFQSWDDGEVWDLWAYDVDADEWTELGPVTVDRDTPCCTQIDLLGYSAELDRLILVTPFGGGGATILVDPRTGQLTMIAAPDVPIVDLAWPSHAYGQANGTAYVYDQTRRALCGFQAETLTWTCHKAPAELPTEYVAFAAITGDPINNRLILINGVHGDWWTDATDDVWAVDFGTSEWIQLVDQTES